MTRLLVSLRALGLGDFLTGVPALRALREAFPDHHQVLAAPAVFAPLVAAYDLADTVSPTAGLEPLGQDLGHPDVAVDLHGRGPGSQPILLALGPRRLVAFAHPDIPATRGGPEWRAGEHEVTRWCRMLAESGVVSDPSRLDLAPELLPHRTLEPWLAGCTVVHPGAASRSRRWPIERFAAVARHEGRRGRTVVVTGSAGEVDLCARLAALAGLGADRVLAGRHDLPALLAVVAGAGRVVCGDTGVAHAATAFATPSVVLFGPVPPAEWGPPDRPWHFTLWSGRRGDPHGRVLDPGLATIGVDEVCAALDRLPDAPRA